MTKADQMLDEQLLSSALFQPVKVGGGKDQNKQLDTMF